MFTLTARLPLLVALLLPTSGVTCFEEGLIFLSGLPFNFHTIEELQAYRSAQPTGDQLVTIIERFSIKTVINLRGPNAGQAWYDTELSVCEAMGVTQVDHRMSAQSLPAPETLEAVIETLLTAEYPILIHCKGGADRTGLVSVIYRMLVLGHDKSEALAELSFDFYHFRPATPCMDTVAEAYQPTDDWLDQYADTFEQMTCTP